MKTINNDGLLRVFEKVALHQSFTQAAKELGISKAFVSKCVQELEEQFACQLFRRSTRTVNLSREGEKLFSKCHGHLAALESVRNEFINSSERVTGEIKVSLAGAFSEKYIAPLLISFMRDYPDVKVRAEYTEKMADLIKDKVDLAIRFGEQKDSGLITRQIAQRKEIVCASPAFLKAHGVPKTPQDLKGMNCLIIGRSQWSFKEAGRRLKVKVSGNFHCNNARSVTDAAIAGLGVCKLPEVYLKGAIRRGELIQLLGRYMDSPSPVSAVTLQKDKMPLALRILIDHIESGLREVQL